MGVGQIGLEHHAGGQGQELLLVEHLAKRRDGEVEVPVLLHVQVDELRGDMAVGMAVVVPPGLAVERPQRVLHLLDRRAEGDEVDLARDRGHLDRDVLDVLARQERHVGGEPPRRLLLAEDRLAELVQIEARPRCPPLRQVAPEVVLLGGQDEGLALVAEPRQDRGDDHAGEIVGHDAAEDQAHALPPLHEARRAVAVEEIGDLIGDALGTPAAKGLIGERDRQLLAARVLHHAREPARLRALIRRLAGQASRKSASARATARRARSARRLAAAEGSNDAFDAGVSTRRTCAGPRPDRPSG
jgi:hypothetical protein